MTLEDFNKATEIRESISEAEKQLPLLDMKINRFDDYINFMDGRINPIKAHGKVYKKAEIKFNINERITDTDTRLYLVYYYFQYFLWLYFLLSDFYYFLFHYLSRCLLSDRKSVV